MKKCFFIILVSVMCWSGYAQEFPSPMEQILPGPDWITGLKNGRIPGWLYYSEVDMSGRLATSYRDGFEPGKVNDGYINTAWASENDSINEVIVVDFDDNSRVWWIWTGYGKSTQRFLENNRPRKVQVSLVGTYCTECTSNFCVVGNFTVVNSIVVELQDVNTFQSLPVPKQEIKNNLYDCARVGEKNKAKPYIYKLAIQILSVYPGSKPNGTYISEIMNHSEYTQWLTRKN